METFNYKGNTEGGGGGKLTMFVSKFGDGYSQDIPNGINNDVQTHTVVCNGQRAYAMEVLAFVRRNKGQSFFWKAPLTDSVGTYKCKEYSWKDVGGGYFVITLTFEQSFQP